MTENTIVSAFFAIGRENYKNIPRTNNQYIEFFKRWARIKNDLIFFCEDEQLAKLVVEIRDSFGLKDKTKTVVLDNITTLAPDIYNKMAEIENSEHFKNFRCDNTLPENKAMYNYVMYLKSFCIKEAQKLVDKDCKFITWLDFGWEHGGEAFADEQDYAFEWKYDFGDKVNYFYIPPMDERPIFEICRTLDSVCMMGSPFVVPVNLADWHFNAITDCYKSLLNIGLMDDDQLFFLLNSRVNPDKIELKPSYWFLPIKDYGGSHFKLKPAPKTLNFFQKCKRKVKKMVKKIVGKK